MILNELGKWRALLLCISKTYCAHFRQPERHLYNRLLYQPHHNRAKHISPEKYVSDRSCHIAHSKVPIPMSVKELSPYDC